MALKKVLVVNSQHGVTELFRKEKEKYWVMFEGQAATPDLLVFTGGADISPVLYGEQPIKGTSCNKSRDDEDLAYWTKYPKVPKVGICRGGQFLNVMSGGSMWQNVSNHGSSHLMHNLLNVPSILEKSLMVTSTHHQMMIAGPEGEVIGIATNNKKDRGLSDKYESFVGKVKPKFDTEVVWYPKTNSLCFQPHPEYNQHPEMREYFFKLLNYFF